MNHDNTLHAPKNVLTATHSPDAIRARLSDGPRYSYLKDFVYGAIDGAVTTFAVVSGVAGAGLSPGIIVVMGVANLVGDGFSMAASNFLGTRAESQHRDRLRRIEEEHIDRIPDGEREEIRQIMNAQGFEDDDLNRAVEIITGDRQRWVETMLKEEHGVALAGPVPWKSALATFIAFISIGLIPLLPFLVRLLGDSDLSAPYLWSTMMTGVAFFAVGAAKSYFVDQHWTWSGLETLAVGSGAAGLAYLCGVLLQSFA